MSSDVLDSYVEAKADGALEVLEELRVWLRNEINLNYSQDSLAFVLGKAVDWKIGRLIEECS